MIKLTLLAVTALLSFSSAADEAVEYCAGVSKLAGQIMEMRQDNYEMSEMYTVLRGHAGSLTIVKMAYESPLYNGDKYKAREIARFKNEIFMICVSEVK